MTTGLLSSAGNAQDQPVSSNSGTNDPIDRVSKEVDDKKLKRKISNRESARRSRWRKKRHLEDVTVQMNQLKAQNREFKNRLGSLLYQLYAVNTQNERLRVESCVCSKHTTGFCTPCRTYIQPRCLTLRDFIV
ncbi:hypothetical protein V2J09_007471 [Rumex salicifolius]